MSKSGNIVFVLTLVDLWNQGLEATGVGKFRNKRLVRFIGCYSLEVSYLFTVEAFFSLCHEIPILIFFILFFVFYVFGCRGKAATNACSNHRLKLHKHLITFITKTESVL